MELTAEALSGASDGSGIKRYGPGYGAGEGNGNGQGTGSDFGGVDAQRPEHYSRFGGQGTGIGLYSGSGFGSGLGDGMGKNRVQEYRGQ